LWWWSDGAVVGLGVVKREIRWRFQVGCDVVLMRWCVWDGGDGRVEWSGVCWDGECRGVVVVVDM
jgi:hypothetical protein